MTHQALNWFVSYFDVRSMFVRRSGTSSARLLATMASRKAHLWDLCFNLYIASLSSVIGSFGVRHHQYADDTQMYIAASKDDLEVNIDTIEKCTTGVHQWLLHSCLQLNPSKSEAILFTTGRRRQSVDDAPSLQVSDAVVQPSTTIKSRRHIRSASYIRPACGRRV